MLRLGILALKTQPTAHFSVHRARLPASLVFARYLEHSSTHDGSLNVTHSHFLSHAKPSTKWKREGSGALNGEDEVPVDELEGVSDGQGKLLPTSSHLFKLILPLGNLSHPSNTRSKPTGSESHADSKVPPTVILLHPSQPLSHVSRLIQASLNPALPIVSFRSVSSKGQAFQWSDSTDIGDFIRDAARSAQFSICLTYEPTQHLKDTVLKHDSGKLIETKADGGTEVASQERHSETIIEVTVPTFADRTRYLRRRLKAIEAQLANMEGLKRQCDHEAHRGARRMAVTGFGMLVVYWGGVARLTFWDYGWDIMEPITYLSGLSTVILGYLWFLYRGREVSYSSVLAQSINARRDALYKSHDFDIERWAELVSERKSLGREIGRIAEDYEEREAKEYEDVTQDEPVNNTGDVHEDVVKPNPTNEAGREEEFMGQISASKTNN
ncbi:hypothetical protein MD484_g634, partial [Candolleomyces efflorescens]